MSRFYCLPQEVEQDKIVIRRNDSIHHIVDVMRQKIGDKVVVFDGSGKEYRGGIQAVSKQSIVIKIGSINVCPESDIKLTLACAIPKKCKFDFIVQKVTELGVDEVIPIVTVRTVVKIDYKDARSKIARWQKIAVEAAKQCGRVRLPKIERVLNFIESLSLIKDHDMALIPHLSDDRKDLRDLDFSKVKSAIVFIGPEGDFTPEEIKRAITAGCIPVTLGHNILKVDTAAIFVVGLLSFLLRK